LINNDDSASSAQSTQLTSNEERKEEMQRSVITLTKPDTKRLGHSINHCRRYFNSTSFFSKNEMKGCGEGQISGNFIMYNSLSNCYQSIPFSPSGDSLLLAARKKEENESTIASSSRATKENEEKNIIEKGLAWYTCGPTVYDSTHLGHARTYICLDFIRRIIQHLHSNANVSEQQQQTIPEPLFIMNITDIDDKIIQRSKELKISPLKLARKYEEEFWKDLDTLNVLRPHVITRVTEHVDLSIIPYIEKIIENGMAYVIPDDANGETEEGKGSVYFDVRAFESIQGGGINRYGKLAPPLAATSSENNNFFGWDGNNDGGKDLSKSHKKDPRDFVLWKSRPNNNNSNDNDEEGNDPCWDSPWGHGRPGWHIECSAMIDHTMSKFPSHEMYVHAGGIDLKFPHHTNEIAQAEAYHYKKSNNNNSSFTKEWIPHWVHTGHLHISGLKMSKSLKNFITVRQLLSDGDTSVKEQNESDLSSSLSPSSSSLSSVADDFRLWCLGLSGSYRGPATYSERRLEEARTLRGRIVRFLLDGEEWIRESSNGCHQPPRLWGTAEHNLFQISTEVSSKCDLAIIGCASLEGSSSNNDNSVESSKTMASYDFDGSVIVHEMVRLAEAGSAYVSSSKVGDHPVEALQGSIDLLRKKLSLFGFTDRTVRAGIVRSVGVSGDDGHGSSIKGGERALADELVSFRSAIRKAALSHIRSGDSSVSKTNTNKAINDILKLCDAARDRTLPALGLDISDSDVEGGEKSQWRFCVPRNSASSDLETVSKNQRKPTVPKVVPVKDMFRVGQYEGMFSQYDDEGMPTHNSDGSEVSNRLRKKLKKKRDKFTKKS